MSGTKFESESNRLAAQKILARLQELAKTEPMIIIEIIAYGLTAYSEWAPEAKDFDDFFPSDGSWEDDLLCSEQRAAASWMGLE